MKFLTSIKNDQNYCLKFKNVGKYAQVNKHVTLKILDGVNEYRKSELRSLWPICLESS